MAQARPNRVRVYETEHIAREIRETFTAKKAREKIRFPFNWPVEMQNVGDSLAVAYSSDKWKDEGDMELYKHLAESRNRALCVDGFLRDANRPEKQIPTIGPWVSFTDVLMPKTFAILALFEEADLMLHTRGTDDDPDFGRKSEGVVKVTVAHGILGGATFSFGGGDVPFLFVYTEKDGPLMILVGEELDIEKDGIVG